ncbi:MAG: RepB family plasmid replication initiator protein [Betaproteobacteria bacterium]|nr:RepB family plasmid replication initiator protein [Betaproteobacteria bacterium]
MALELRRKQEEQAVSKANEAIAIRPKRGKLTLLSRRIYNVFLYHAQRQGVDKPNYSILLSELIDDARFTSNNTELLKSHIRDMQATTIEWHTSAAGARQWTSTQLLGPVTIDEPGRGRACTLTWSYPEPIRERLVRPAQYTRVLLEISSQMRSYAASVLYELGARYLTSPGRLTMREDVIWWASVLTGRSDITSVDYRILHRDTIKKALAELDTLSEDFRLEVVEHKRGRKVEELQFRVIAKPQASTDGLRDAAKTVFDLELVERLVVLGVKRAEAQDLYAVTDEGVLRAAVDHVEQRIQSQNLPALKSAAAYLRDALKRQYAGAGEGDAKLAPPRTNAVPSVDEKLQRLREEWQHQKAVEAKSLFNEMTEAQRSDQLQRFETERLGELASPIAKAWRRDGINSRIAASSFFRWLPSALWPGQVTDKELLDFAMSRAA